MTTRKQLEAMVVRINELLHADYELDKQLGGYRLTANQGSRDVSPRLAPRLMSLWLSGMLTGAQEFSAKIHAVADRHIVHPATGTEIDMDTEIDSYIKNQRKD